MAWRGREGMARQARLGLDGVARVAWLGWLGAAGVARVARLGMDGGARMAWRGRQGFTCIVTLRPKEPIMAHKPIAETDDTAEAAELFAEIEAAEKELWRLTLEENTAKLTLKEKKDAREAGEANMRKIARTRLNSGPLFDQSNDGNGDGENEEA